LEHEIYRISNSKYCLSDKILPYENSDYSMPGRSSESNFTYLGNPVPKPKSRALVIAVISFAIVSTGFFSYYFVNQNEIDSQIMDNTSLMTVEEKMIKQYDIGEFGSSHAHAVLTVFVDEDQLNFGLPQFQLQSKYIHFEDHNSYLIHRHATNVPLEMLFTSFGLKVTSECIELNNESGGINYENHCTDSENSMSFFVNGKQVSNITEYEVKHNDRILISFGDSESIEKELEYLNSLQIHDIPKKNNLIPSKDISV
jgi:hypothetical protein